MAVSEINAGICGFITKVTTTDVDGKIKIAIESDCPNVKKMAVDLTEVEPYKEVLVGIGSTLTFKLADKYLPHPSCIVPAGILKTIEVESNLALPKEACVKTTRS